MSGELREYFCWPAREGERFGESVWARSRGAAKAEYWRALEDAWPDYPYTGIRCRVARAWDQTGDSPAFDYIRDRYGVHSRPGQTGHMDGRAGTVTRTESHYLWVVFDDGGAGAVHPRDWRAA